MVSVSKLKGLLLVGVDIVLINLAYIFTLLVRFSLNGPSLGDIPTEYWIEYFKAVPIISIIYIVLFSVFRMYKSLWDFAGIDEVMSGAIACTIGCFFSMFLYKETPIIINILAGVLVLILTIGTRLSFRVYRRLVIFGSVKHLEDQKNVLIIGAGSCGRLVINEMRRETGIGFKPIGVIDDDKGKIGTYINGIKVLGDRKQIENIVKNEKVDLILIAIALISSEKKRELIEICQETGVKVKIMPGIYEMMDGKVNLTKMRDVDLKDLLGREEVKLSKDEIAKYLDRKRVLVTGGGGSIGSELCRQIALFNPKELIILDIYENNAYDLENELNRTFPDLNKKVVIASVRDKRRIEDIFVTYKPEVVFHAAAHKHVPLMETSPGEAIKNNVCGTLNVAECADKFGVDRFVLISTDKAVNPTNVMGATKRICEIIIQAINKRSKTEFVAVRFGNVLGSNGSVIPLFKKQIAEGGPVTLTNKYITRYFMLIPEAAQLVLQAGAYARGGEIFVLDMGKPVKIYDLAKNLIRLSGFEPFKDINIRIVGLRPGEKLYEELLMNEEGLTETPHEKIFIGKSGDFNLDYVKDNVNKLLYISKYGTGEELRDYIEVFVPTYKRLDKEEKNTKEEAAATTLANS